MWGSLSDQLGLVQHRRGVCFCCASLSMAALAVTGTEGLGAPLHGGGRLLLRRTGLPPHPLTARMFGPRYITENYGVMYVVFGLASLIGPSLATTFKTAGGGSYTGAYVDRRGAGRHRPGALPLPESPVPQRENDMELSKVRTAEEIIARFKDGQIIAIGGQTNQYMPDRLIDCVLESGARHLTIYSIDSSDPGHGVSLLVEAGRVDAMITTHVGTNP